MRIGIVVKPGLVEARETLTGIEAWLSARAVDAVWASEAAALRLASNRRVVAREQMPHEADLVLVLGGDGTLLAMADIIAQADRDLPILGVNFGSLGFLTEVTRPEIYASLEAALEGRATHDERMMLRATAKRAGGATKHVALNDIVFTRTALGLSENWPSVKREAPNMAYRPSARLRLVALSTWATPSIPALSSCSLR